MEHIVQFAIGIDDETIQKRIENNAYNDILENLIADIKKDLPKTYGGVNWRRLVDDAIEEFIQENKDEIIETAAKELCESFRRTKAFKERMKESMEDCFR